MLTQPTQTNHSSVPQEYSCIQMVAALGMETVHVPTLAHVVMVLLDEDYCALLLLLCRNPEIRAFWRYLLVYPTHNGRPRAVPLESQGSTRP